MCEVSNDTVGGSSVKLVNADWDDYIFSFRFDLK